MQQSHLINPRFSCFYFVQSKLLNKVLNNVICFAAQEVFVLKYFQKQFLLNSFKVLNIYFVRRQNHRPPSDTQNNEKNLTPEKQNDTIIPTKKKIKVF